jgi:RNA polymerase sigma-70 factor (ECF subfamily)
LTAGTTDRLFGAARLILRDDEHAADAVQDALLQAWLDLRGLRDPDRFDAWLHRLARPCLLPRRETGPTAEGPSSSPLDATLEPTTPDAQRAVAVRDQLDRGFRACRRSSGR